MDEPVMSGLAGKRAIVTGCHSGIGHAVARQLLYEHWLEVPEVLDRFATHAVTGEAMPVDLRDRSSIDAALSGHDARVDMLFNCAGIPPGAPPLDVMKVNYVGTRHITDRLVPHMQPGSAIVNVASTGGMGWPGHLADLQTLIEAHDFDAGLDWCAAHPELVAEGYRFSKEAVIVWTMTQSARLIQRGIRINCTLPGAVQTPMLVEIEKVTPTAVIDQVAQPIGRRSSPDEQAEVLLFLNSPQAGYINGAALPVDGGFMASLTVR